jgi:hypothetical protein
MDDDPAAARKRSIRRHRKSVFMTKDGHVPMKHKPRAPAPVTGSYEAQITKTTDGTAVRGVCFVYLCAHALCNSKASLTNPSLPNNATRTNSANRIKLQHAGDQVVFLCGECMLGIGVG